MSANTLLPHCPDGDCVCAISVYSKTLTLQFAVEVEGFPLPLHIIPISQKRSWVFKGPVTQNACCPALFSIRKANGVVSARNISGKAVRTPRGELSWPRRNCFLSFTVKDKHSVGSFKTAYREVDSFPQAPKISNILQLPSAEWRWCTTPLVQHSGATLLHCRVNGITSQPQDDKLIKLQYGKKPEAPGVENRSTEKQNEQ